ncbi:MULTISPECIES: transcriptional regulator [Acidianus]|nr:MULTISPECIES: transcriptional regulator [Acidianus]NON61854.1 transcriptional regulator [Acidianus sp. RZ1]
MARIIAPCEVAVRDVIPAVKAILIDELRKHGLSQMQISVLMGISTADVNYYLKGKRGNDELKKTLESNDDFMEMVDLLVRRMIRGEEVMNICPLCSVARKVKGENYPCPYDY